MSARSHLAPTIRLALPVMLNRAGLVVMLFVDTSIAGHVGLMEQARFGAALIPVIVLQVVAIGVLIGVIIRVASADGAGQKRECGQIWRIGMLIALFMGCAYAIALGFGAPILTHVLQQPASLAKAAGPVLSILGWGMPGVLLYAACAHALEGMRRPDAPLVVMIFANIVNALLAYALAFGAWGAPALGAEGVAIATTVTRTGMGIAGVVIVLRSPRAQEYGLSLDFSDGLKGLGDLLRLGAPLALAISLETMCFSVIINMGSWISDEAIATMAAAINYTSLIYMLTIGLSTAASVRVANALSAQDWPNAARAGWVAAGLTAGVMAAAASLTAIFAEPIAGVYTADRTVFNMLAPLLGAGVSVLLVVDGIQGVLMGALRGCADTFWPTLIYGVSFWVLGVPIAYFWGYSWGGGPSALVASLTIALSVAMLALAVRFLRLTQRAKIY